MYILVINMCIWDFIKLIRFFFYSYEDIIFKKMLKLCFVKLNLKKKLILFREYSYKCTPFKRVVIIFLITIDG